MIAVVTGMIATYPVGGVVWDYGQYALGLERLGFDVLYLEDTGWMAYDPRVRSYVEDPAYGVAYLQSALHRLSPTLGRRWHVRGMDGRTYGMDAAEVARWVARADLFLNVSGGTLLRDAYMACPRKVLIDTDPGWNHFRNYPRLDADPTWGGGHGWRAHDAFFTYAERLGAPDCVLPALGIDWQPTRPPVVLDCWSPQPPGDTWTTVLTWKNHSETIEHAGVRYGTKEMEFERVEHLPSQVDARMEIAAGGTGRPADPEAARTWYPVEPRWTAHGWSVVDAHAVSDTPEAYRDYVARSRAEFSVAKNVYVATGSGWFSCRSTCYLACGRPVVVQDTGFSRVIPTGEGVLAFTTPQEAIEAVREVEAHYGRHREAARAVAAAHFASEVVLGDLLHRIGLGPAARGGAR